MMEAMFTLPYAEFCVAQQLSRLLPAKSGYRMFVPASRQEPGVDLVLAQRIGGRTRVATIQVKTSRTYNPRPAVKMRNAGLVTKRSFRYYTWFQHVPLSTPGRLFRAHRSVSSSGHAGAARAGRLV